MKQKRQIVFGMILGAMAVSAFGVSMTNEIPFSFAKTTKKSAESSLNISLGKAYFTDALTTTQTYHLNDFAVSGSDEIASVSVTVSSGSVTATTDDTAYKVYTDFLKDSTAKHKTAIFAFKKLQSSATVSTYIRTNLLFDSSANSSADVNNQTIRFSFNLGSEALYSNVPDDDAVSTLIDSNDNTHFYIFDMKAAGGTAGSSWETAYNYAKTLKLFGMKGYLVTITSSDEDKVLDSITTQAGWAGAECDVITTPDADTVTGLGQATTGRGTKTNWKWVCGPESLAPNDPALFDSTGASKGYSNWGDGEPNGYSKSSEWLLNIHFGSTWNDYGTNANNIGAFVEFSPYPTSDAISFKENVLTGNWKDWAWSKESGFANQGIATRTTNQGSGSETWDTIPVLPQPSQSILGVTGSFWTETLYTAPTSDKEGSVTFTASSTHSPYDNENATAYSFTVPKTLMKLAQAGADSTTLLTGLTAGSLYKITMSDGSSLTITADSSGQFNLGTYDQGSWLGKTLATMVMVDSSGATISETQTLPATTIRQKYDVPAPSVNYGDNDTVTISKLSAGHTYTIEDKTYVADASGSLTISGVLSTSAVNLSITDTSVDATRYIDSEAGSIALAAKAAAPSASAYAVTEATTDSEKASVNVPLGSEYYDVATGTWIKGAATALVTPGQSLKVRVSATGTAPASDAVEVPTKAFKQPTPVATIDYKAGMFHGLIKNSVYTIDGKDYTTDANGDLEIDIPLYGHTFTLIKKHVHDDGSDINSDPQTLTAIAMPDAPDASNYPVTEATSSSEKAEVVIPSGSEYKDPTTGKWVKGATTALVTPGTSIEVRVSGTETRPFSHNTTISTKAYQWPTPTASVDYADEKLTGLIAGGTYTINGQAYTADANGNIPMEEAWYGTSLSIIKSHVNSDGSDLDSTAESVVVTSRPSAPSDEDVSKKDNDDGSETVHVTDTQEYSLDGGKTWIKGTNNDVVVSGTDTVMVRTAATATSPAGAATTVQGDSTRPYRSTPTIVAYCLGFLILLLLAYRFIIFARWHSKDKHSHLGFFVANNRWMNQILFHTPYNKVELQAQEAAKQAAENKQEGK